MNLTRREHGILRCRCELGLTREETARRLNVDETTIAKNIYTLLCYLFGRYRLMESLTVILDHEGVS
jgi:hypothetical protein